MGKVLVVDDEESVRFMLSEMITADGMDVITAVDGVDALAQIMADQNGPKEIYTILSDIDMPRMDGIELLKEVNTREIDIPFIILTGFGAREKIMTALRYGAYDFQDKPVHEDRLLTALKEAFKFGKEMKNFEVEVEKLMGNMPPASIEERKQLRTQIEVMVKLKFGRKSRLSNF
jgi:DNA-binding NtrC family response regulator